MEAQLKEFRQRQLKLQQQMEEEKKRELDTAENNGEEDDECLLPDSSERERPVLPHRLRHLIFALKLLLWLILCVFCVRAGFAVPFLIVSTLYAMYKYGTRNSTRRADGAPSAYSVFNPNCEAIDGTLTAEQFEAEIRHGPFGR